MSETEFARADCFSLEFYFLTQKAKKLERIESLLKSLLSEDGMREQFSSYNVGMELLNILEGEK